MPKISILIICYNMRREVPRTVQSFLPPYQQGVDAGDVEVIVLENGSPEPLLESTIAEWGSSVRYVKVPNPSPSPAHALNLGVKLARAPVVCPVIDGARMASPGLLKFGLKALEDHPGAFVTSVGFHLGFERQSISAVKGYDQAEEDRLLEQIDWLNNGYSLFKIAATAGSAQAGWFGTVSESNAPIMTKQTYDQIGGFDPAFDIPGGGLVNLDFFKRVMDDSTIPHLMILGEGTFHQFHGGVTTSKADNDIEEDGRTAWKRYTDQYHSIRGKPFSVVRKLPILYGTLRPEMIKLCAELIEQAQN